MPSFASRRLRAVLVLVALAVALASFGLWLASSSLVRVSAVTVTGIEGPQAAEIRDALTVAALDMSTLAIDQQGLRRSVARYPIVRGLRTSTDVPHRLRIAVDARKPVAALSAGGALTAVAADGTILRASPTTDQPVIGIGSLPSGDRVRDADALRAIRLLDSAPQPLHRRVARVFRGTRGLAATVQEGPKLYFGGGDRLSAKWSAAAKVLAHDGARGATYIDVRIPGRPVAGGYPPRQDKPSASTLG